MKKIMSILIICTVLLAVGFVTDASLSRRPEAIAGSAMQMIADKASLLGDDGISYSYWRYDQGAGIIQSERANGDKIVKFGGTTAENGWNYDIGNPLIARRKAVLDTDTDSFETQFTLKLISISGSKRFGFLFGLERLSGDAGSEGSIFFYFERTLDGYKYGLSRFTDDGEYGIIPPSALPGSITTGLAANDFIVKIKAFGTGRIQIWLSDLNTTIYDGITSEAASYSGYIGFAQDGVYSDKAHTINAELSDFYAYNAYNERPQTPEVINEDFETGDFDLNSWSLKTNGGVYVDKGKLVFERAVLGGNFYSRYTYSNFEITYTMSDFVNAPIPDAKSPYEKRGATLYTAFNFGFHSSNNNYTLEQAIANGYFLFFRADTDRNTGLRTGATKLTLMYRGNNIQGVTLSGEQDFMRWSDSSRAVGISISMIDAVLTVKLRTDWGESGQYEQILSYTTDNGTPMGNIGFWCESESAYWRGYGVDLFSDYTIDSIVLKNMDRHANTIPLPTRVSSKTYPTSDYSYTDTWSNNDLLSNKIGLPGFEPDRGSNAGLYIAGTGGAVVIAGAGIAVAVKKKRKGKV